MFELTKKAKKQENPFSIRLAKKTMNWVYEEAKKQGKSRNQIINSCIASAMHKETN